MCPLTKSEQQDRLRWAQSQVAKLPSTREGPLSRKFEKFRYLISGYLSRLYLAAVSFSLSVEAMRSTIREIPRMLMIPCLKIVPVELEGTLYVSSIEPGNPVGAKEIQILSPEMKSDALLLGHDHLGFREVMMGNMSKMPYTDLDPSLWWMAIDLRKGAWINMKRDVSTPKINACSHG